MATIYKIHPAIGVARVGNSPDGILHRPGITGFTRGGDRRRRHRDSPDSSTNTTGWSSARPPAFGCSPTSKTLQATSNWSARWVADARVEWTVDLVNRKAALGRDAGPAQPRNIDIADRNSLIIRGPQPATIAGAGQPAREIKGTFLGKNVYLGELRTDGNGRLIVLGGRGNSGSVPPNQPLRNFANNNRWHDDVSDGPVNAIVTLPGQAPVVVHEPAWVVVAPPDFAPTVDPIVSLYDIAYQAGIDKGALRPEDRPSFTRHIKPMIARMVDMRWVDDFDEWDRLLPIDWDVLADPSPSAAAARARDRDAPPRPGPARLPIAGLSAAVCAANGPTGISSTTPASPRLPKPSRSSWTGRRCSAVPATISSRESRPAKTSRIPTSTPAPSGWTSPTPARCTRVVSARSWHCHGRRISLPARATGGRRSGQTWS